MPRRVGTFIAAACRCQEPCDKGRMTRRYPAVNLGSRAVIWRPTVLAGRRGSRCPVVSGALTTTAGFGAVSPPQGRDTDSVFGRQIPFPGFPFLEICPGSQLWHRAFSLDPLGSAGMTDPLLKLLGMPLIRVERCVFASVRVSPRQRPHFQCQERNKRYADRCGATYLSL